MKVFFNNKITDKKNAKISIECNGFQYGIGFFTTLKYSDGICHFLQEHVKRLKNSLLKYNLKPPKINYEMIIKELIKVNQLEFGRVKITHYLNENDTIGTYIKTDYYIEDNKPKILKVHKSLRGDNELYKHKSLNFFENVYYKKEAESQNFNEFLFLDYNNNILETCYSNIFFLKENTLFTPISTLPILNGIIRQQFIQNKFQNFKIIEKEINVDEIKSFSGCFLTNSINNIVPIEKIIYNQKIIHYSIISIDTFIKHNKLRNKTSILFDFHQ